MERSRYLRPLSQDHHHGLVFAQRLRLGVQKKADPATLVAFAAHGWTHDLSQHFEREEAYLLPELDQLGARTLGARLREEHEAIAGLIRELNGESDYSALDRLADTLRQHIRFEERELFPFLEKELESEVLDRIGEYLNGEAHRSEETWSLAFWK